MKFIHELQTDIHELAKSKGWYDGKPRTKLELLALVHAEISEAVEEIRKDRPPLYKLQYDDAGNEYYVTEGTIGWEKPTKIEGELIELADAVIRILDYCEYHGMDLERAIMLKHEYNKSRSYRHGNKKY